MSGEMIIDQVKVEDKQLVKINNQKKTKELIRTDSLALLRLFSWWVTLVLSTVHIFDSHTTMINIRPHISRSVQLHMWWIWMTFLITLSRTNDLLTIDFGRERERLQSSSFFLLARETRCLIGDVKEEKKICIFYFASMMF